MKLFNKTNKTKRGAVLMIVAVVIMVLIGFVGLAIDFGLAATVASQLQSGADAAALAGAQYVRTNIDQARASAQAIALANYSGGTPIHVDLNTGNDATGDIVVGRWNRMLKTFTPQLTNCNAVMVTARRTAGSTDGSLSLLFGPIFGVATTDLQRSAIAITGGSNDGFIILDPASPKAFWIKGSSILTVNGGGIHVDSSSASALTINGSDATVTASAINIVGDALINAGANLGDTEINPNSRYVADPLSLLPAPPITADLGKVKITVGTYTLNPGYYSGGFTFTGGTITLNPGIYVLGGAGFQVSGGANINGQGVMFYIESGAVGINGTGNITLRAPNANVDTFPGVNLYEGLLFFQSRTNSSDNSINGTSGLNLTGTLYFPHANVTLTGTSNHIGNQFIAYTAIVSGNSDITINYNGTFPTPGNLAFLVK